MCLPIDGQNFLTLQLQLDGLEKSFYSFYVCTAVRKFFFFLDPLRTGKVKIQDILACSFLDDLLEVCGLVFFFFFACRIEHNMWMFNQYSCVLFPVE